MRSPPPPARRDRARWLAVAASLVLHGALLAWLGTQAPGAGVDRAEPPPPPALVWFEPAPSSEAAPPRPAPAPPRTVGAGPRAPAPVAARPSPAGGPGPTTTPPPTVSAQRAAPDAPGRLGTLLPSQAFLERGGLALPAPEAPGGRTLHPEDLPGPEELLAEEEVRVGTTVQGVAQGALAEARVTSGLVDPYFHDLRRQLTRDIGTAPDFTDAANPRNLPKTLVGSWSQAAESYGKTGTAYDAPVTRESIAGPGEIPSLLQREIERGSGQAATLAMQLYAGARLRDFGQGKMGAELYAEVELRQGATGAVAGVRLVQRSGVATFDGWVLQRAASAVDALGPLDAGARPEGYHSVWGFSGRVSYMRSSKDITLKDDWAYLALASMAGLTTGTFDEMTGTAQYVDLRHPHYECSVKLLRVYEGPPGAPTP